MDKNRVFIILFFFSAALTFFRPLPAGSEPVEDPDVPFMPGQVKALVDKTFSVYASERAEAAFKLGMIGEEADKAAPFLMRLLDDNLPVWCRYNGYGMWTTPGKEASKALALIGEGASGYLSLLAANNHPYIYINAHMERNLSRTLQKITGTDYGNDFERWHELLEKKQP